MDKYIIERWKQYDVVDNGVFAPKGSSPKFHTESGVFRWDTNPIHPLVDGYIMHDKMPGDELIRKRRIQYYNLVLDKPDKVDIRDKKINEILK